MANEQNLLQNSKKKRVQKTYTYEDKMEVLKLLELNNWNVNATANDTKIQASTIRSWREKYGGELDRVSKFQEMTSKVVSKAEAGKAKFFDTVFEAKMEILERMRELISDESNLDKLTRAFSALSHADGTIKASDTTEEKSVNLFQQINNYLVERSKNKNNGEKN